MAVSAADKSNACPHLTAIISARIRVLVEAGQVYCVVRLSMLQASVVGVQESLRVTPMKLSFS